MRAYIAILAAFMRRLDRWLLLREPMLWRAKPPRWLVLVSLAVIVIAAIPLMLTSIKVPADVDDLTFDTVTIRTALRYGVALALWMWAQSIAEKPVGELAPRRHI